MIYFLGSTKSTDENRRFYNACAGADSDYQQVIQKSELERIGKSANSIQHMSNLLNNCSLGIEMQVTSDIKKAINTVGEESPNYYELR